MEDRPHIGNSRRRFTFGLIPLDPDLVADLLGHGERLGLVVRN